MMKQLAILCVLSNFFLTTFGQTKNNKGVGNTPANYGTNANQKNYSKLKLIDQFNNILQKDTATMISRAQFSPIYIGFKKTEVKITYKPSTVGNRAGKRGNHKKPDSKLMIITIDTTKTVGSPMGVYETYTKAEFRDNKIAYPVFIENLSSDTLDIGFGNVFPIIMEAKDEDGSWKAIQKKFIYECGKGLSEFYLAPKQIAITTMIQFEGTFKTKLRLVFSYSSTKVYSNEIDGFINRGQFK